MKKKNQYKYRGVAMIYALMIMTALCMILSLAVDYGHAQLVKTELRRTADAAARAAAAYIYSDLNAGTSAAIDVASRNKSDGSSVTLSPTDIQFGNWDVNSKKFTLTSSSSQINAVRVVASRTQARGDAVPMMFAHVLGRNFCDVQAETVVMSVAPLNVNQNVPATANPFLAGMPAGSEASNTNPHKNPDFAGDSNNPKQSPIAVDMGITEGEVLNFDSIDGTARHDPNDPYYSPDGNPGDWGHNILNTDPSKNSYEDQTTLNAYSQNGIADANIPINALVGVFLDDKQPSLSNTPQGLDFSTADERDFTSIGAAADNSTSMVDRPLKLKQIFFIGDGMTSKGIKQSFVAPKGATRLFLATWDFYEWNNNAGQRNIKISRPGQIITVK
jgi:hypothetical protein